VSGTTTRNDRTIDTESTPAANALAPPPKLRRRPALVAAAIVAICLGALLAGWAWTATTNTQEILVARDTIPRGSVIEADDLARVRVSADPALSPVAAAELDNIVGQRAALDIAEGSMLTAESATSDLVPESGMSVVGVALAPEQAPGLSLQTGDSVRVVQTPAQGEDPPPGPPQISEAEVVDVHVVEATGQTVVDLLVRHEEATVLAARIASGNVALVLDSRER
jgi:hypothetical protein